MNALMVYVAALSFMSGTTIGFLAAVATFRADLATVKNDVQTIKKRLDL